MKTKIIILVLISIFHLDVFSETVTITTNDYEPYTKLSNGEGSGVFLEILDEIFKVSGVEIEYKKHPWARGLLLTKNIQVDLAVPIFKTKERQKDFYYSDPVIDSTNKFFYIKGRNIPEKFTWEELSDFKNFKIGGTLGYWYIETFGEVGITLDLATTNEQNFKKLYFGRIDLFVIDEIVGWSIIRELFPEEVDKFATIEKPEGTSFLHAVISKDHPKAKDISEKFNKSLLEIKKSGKYDKIVDRYKK